MVANLLSQSIAMLVSKSISTRRYSSPVKLAKSFPIHKGWDKTDSLDSRPISILPTISKLFDKHVNLHLMGYLYKH